MEQWGFEEEWEESRGPVRRRRPLAWLAGAVAAGTALGVAADFPPGWVLGLAFALSAALFPLVGKRGSQWGILLLAGMLAAVHARQETAGASGLAGRLRRNGEYVQFEAVALEDAVFRPAGAHRASAGIFRARLEAVNRKGSWERCAGEIRVNLHGVDKEARLPRYGERWRLTGVVDADRPYQSGLFTLRRNEAVVSPDRAECVAEGEGNPFAAWCAARRRACRAVLARGLEDKPEVAGVLQSLLLGYREDLPEALRADFASTGTIHIFAISGAHVGMAVMLLELLLGALMVPRTRRFWVVVPFLAVYVTMTGLATSAVRAAVMAGCLSLAPVLRRRGDAFSGLSLAAAAILLASPAQVADIGFLLSFSAVWGILTLDPPLERALLKPFRRDPWALPEHKEEGEQGDPLWLYLLRSGILGLAVWTATMPLTLLMFQLFSPVALVMNIPVMLSALGILLSGVLSLALSGLGPVGAWLGETFNLGAGMVAEALSWAIRKAAQIPGGHCFMAPPPAWGVVLWMAVLGAGCAAAKRGRRAGVPVALATMAALGAAWWGWETTRTRAWVLGAAPGQAMLLQSGRQWMLVDAGPNFRATPLNRQLREAGVNGLDVLVLSHPDARHYGGAPEILDEHPAKEVWLPARRWRVPAFEKWLEELRAKGMPVRELRAGDEGDFGDIHWEALWPPDNLPMACADDACLLLRFSHGPHALLVAGDFGGPQEADYLRRVASDPRRWRVPAAETLVLGRHGNNDASSEDWLRAVNPRLAVASCANSKDERQPSPDTLDRLFLLSLPFLPAEPSSSPRLPNW